MSRPHSAPRLQITAVVERIRTLAKVARPSSTVLTLRRADLDLLQRWPEAASSQEVFTNDGVSYWRGFELRAISDETRGT